MADPIILSLNLGGTTLNYYDFVGTRTAAEFERKLEPLRPYFNRIPSAHLSAVTGAKIFVVPANPRNASPGGAYYRPQGVHRWLGQSGTTNVDDKWLGPIHEEGPPRARAPKHSLGLLSISENRFSRGINIYSFTFLHELAHMIDFSMRFTDHAARNGLSLESLRGVRYGRFNDNGTYVHRRDVGEYFAEAYSRWIINSNEICRPERVNTAGRILPNMIPEGENQAICSARIRGVLERL